MKMGNINANHSHKQSEISLTFRDQFFENIKSLYKAEKLSDLTLIADGKIIPAHRIILSAATPYFAAMFTNNMQERNQQEIILHEIHGNELKALIDFIYTGFIDINETNVFELLETATRIEFTHIEDTCVRFLRDKLNASNCLMTWTLTEPFANLKELTELALTFVEENFVEVTESHEFLLLDVIHLSTLLSSDDLNVYSEEEVFNALSKWVSYDRDNRQCNVKNLLSTIRSSQLKLKFLSENVSKFFEEVNELGLMRDLIYKWKLMPRNQLPMSPRLSTRVLRIIAIGNEPDSLLENRCSEIYCPIIEKWKLFEEFKCERDGFSSVVLGGWLFILGGFCKKTNHTLKSVEKYDFSTKQLKQVEPMISERIYPAATVLNNEIFVAGGDGLSSVEKFDPNSGKWTKVPSMLRVRRDFSLVSAGGRIFAIGGKINASEHLKSVECFDPYKKKWEFIAPMNQKRSGHSVVVHKDRLFAIGGLKGVSVNDSIEYYDPIIDRWTVVETIKIHRYGFGINAFEGFAIVAGGKEADNKPASSVLKIDFEKLSTEYISPMNQERSFFNLIEMPCYNPDN